MGNFNLEGFEGASADPVQIKAENKQMRVHYVNKHTRVVGMTMRAAYEAGLLSRERDDAAWDAQAPDDTLKAVECTRENLPTDETAAEFLKGSELLTEDEMAALLEREQPQIRPAKDLGSVPDVIEAMLSVEQAGKAPSAEFIAEHARVISGLKEKKTIGPLATENGEVGGLDGDLRASQFQF
jgi:hypothetical protein